MNGWRVAWACEERERMMRKKKVVKSNNGNTAKWVVKEDNDGGSDKYRRLRLLVVITVNIPFCFYKMETERYNYYYYCYWFVCFVYSWIHSSWEREWKRAGKIIMYILFAAPKRLRTMAARASPLSLIITITFQTHNYTTIYTPPCRSYTIV